MPDERTRTIQRPIPREAEGLDGILVTVNDAGAKPRSVPAEARGRLLVGRGLTCDVQLDDRTVSEFHVELTVGEHGVMVRDLGSRNGTRVGDTRVHLAEVPFGTAIGVGDTELRLERGEKRAPERSTGSSFGALVGASPIMRELYALLERLARTDLAVLVEGETGTGKELAARALHEHGKRKAGPFVVLDCTAIPQNLAESILFGHEKGAFTGAGERRIGMFEAAAGGTLFLDEVGELPLELQPKLLGVLERREVTPVGGTKARPVDVRIVSASWRDLRQLVNRGAFREDLYYRLAQTWVRMPSLSERAEDVRPLVQHFLARIPWNVTAARSITSEALDGIASRTFNGNVRELKSVVERAAMLADGATITEDDLAFERMMAGEKSRARVPLAPEADDAGDAIEPFKEAKRTLVDDFERKYVARLVARVGTNVSRAAAIAGIERQTLRDLLRRHGIRSDEAGGKSDK